MASERERGKFKCEKSGSAVYCFDIAVGVESARDDKSKRVSAKKV